MKRKRESTTTEKKPTKNNPMLLDKELDFSQDELLRLFEIPYHDPEWEVVLQESSPFSYQSQRSTQTSNSVNFEGTVAFSNDAQQAIPPFLPPLPDDYCLEKMPKKPIFPNLTLNSSMTQNPELVSDYSEEEIEEEETINAATRILETLRAKKEIQVTSRNNSFFSPSKTNQFSSNPQYEQNAKILMALGIEDMSPEHYIPSDGDNPGMVHVGRVALLKNQGGYGLFANQTIPPNTCIGVYTGKEFTSGKHYNNYCKKHPEHDNNYSLVLSRKIIDAKTKGNFTRYANFSDIQDNASFKVAKRKGRTVVELVTTKKINKGQQILVNYNEHKPEMSANYYFLNPEDNGNTAQETFKNNAEHYDLMRAPQKIAPLSLEEGTSILAPAVVKVIFENKRLPQVIESAVDLLVLKTNSDHEAIDFDKADAFTPLMLACYLGQYENVIALIQNGANVNRQQHHSGNCPLFLALEGYTAQSSSTVKDDSLKIIEILIDHGANIDTHDRKDSTFIHKAIAALPISEFKRFMRFLNKKHHENLMESFNYVNEDNFDNILYCLSIRSLDKAKILLDLNKETIKSTYDGAKINRENWYRDAFQQIVENYDPQEKEELLQLLEHYKVPAELLKVLRTKNTSENRLAL